MRNTKYPRLSCLLEGKAHKLRHALFAGVSTHMVPAMFPAQRLTENLNINVVLDFEVLCPLEPMNGACFAASIPSQTLVKCATSRLSRTPPVPPQYSPKIE